MKLLAKNAEDRYQSASGTSFKVYLPAVEGSAAPRSGQDEGEKPAGSETILVCEDDGAVRRLAQRILDGAGYTVLVAAHPGEALELASGHPDPIHLLVTDVIMPDMNGKELAEDLTASRSDLKTLYISGYTDDGIAHHGVVEEGVGFLQKPFTQMDLLQRVRAVLDEGAVH
jgi:CheY-like chemotaxis protein